MPIILAPTGRDLRIVRIAADEKIKKHLENLGINVGGEVMIVNTLGENMIVKVKDCRVAVSDELARKIMV